MRKPFATLALLSCLSPVMAADPHLAEVDALVAPLVGDATPGMAVLVTHEGKIIHLRGYGYADLQRKLPVTPDTVFDLASVSKQMTALAAAMLIAEGRWSLDTELSEVLPAFASDGEQRALRVSDLVYHIAALPDYLEVWEEQFSDTTRNPEVVRWLAEQPLEGAPGQTYEYSNSGYLLLASAVAAAAGTNDLRTFLQRHVWGPLQMRHTSMGAPAAGLPRSQVALPYEGEDGEFELGESYASLIEGDGSVLSSVRDLALYERALYEQQLLDEQHTEMLFTGGSFDNGQPIDIGEGFGYGFGWEVGEFEGVNLASHSGSWVGTSTYYLRNLDSGVSVIVLANCRNVDVETLAGSIAALEDE